MDKYFAVIGDPIEQSLSPLMHKAGYRAEGINADYLRFRVSPDKLRDAVKGLCALGYSGWNVTIPHKESILALMDELTPEADKAGAVNTVKFADEKLIGHNTDGNGFVCSVQEYIGVGKKAVIIGAGGAARGIAAALQEKGMGIHILNRTLKRAKELARQIEILGGEAAYGELRPGIWLQEADLLVQTTSVGLHGEPFPVSLEGLRADTLVVDIIYKPWETAFLKEAREKGCPTLNGLPMFLHQGALAWEFWFGRKAPVESMWSALMERAGSGFSGKLASGRKADIICRGQMGKL